MTRGYTLIEIIVVMGICLLLLGALAALYRAFTTLYVYSNSTNATTDSAENIIQATESFGIDADRVVDSYALSSATYHSSSSTLVFELPSLDSTGAIIADTYDYAVFYATGTQAYEVVEANPASARHSSTRMFGNNFSSLSFTYDNADPGSADEVTVDAVSTATAHGSTASDHLSALIRLRNH